MAAPPALHAPLTLDLLRAGKHVVCEKPLCLTWPRPTRSSRRPRPSDRVLTVYQNRRWDPDFVAVRRAVETGLLGDVFNVETFVGGYEHPCRTWHSDTAVSGGAGYDWGSHHVDWVLLLLGGTPRVVQAHGHKRVWHDVTNADQLRVRMTWERRPRGRVLPERHRGRPAPEVLRAGDGRDARRALPHGDVRAHRARPRLCRARGAPRGGARRAPARALRERLRDQRDTTAPRGGASVRVPPEPRRPSAPRRAAGRHAGVGAAGDRRARGGPALQPRWRGHPW